ncbi:MAG: hypothetical protein QOF80_1818, partial [Verrucomicrobiota bacterium]
MSRFRLTGKFQSVTVVTSRLEISFWKSASSIFFATASRTFRSARW